MRAPQAGTVLLALLIAVPSVAQADCWRLPDGRILTTYSGSTAPVAGAQRVACPPPGVTQPQKRAPRPSHPAQTGDPCAKYYGRGYCTDYIQERIGRRPHGDAATWPGNVPVENVRVGDAAIFLVGPAGHAAYVEEVIMDKSTGKPAQVRISEKNWGRVLQGGENQRCVITSNFGRVTSRTVPIASIARVWRP